MGNNKRPPAPSQKRIIEYWRSQPSLPCDVTIDWDTAHEKCWCCGYSDSEYPQFTTEKAHIIPHALGGTSEPENFVLLCSACHHDSPDVNDSMGMWEYIKLKNYPLVTRKHAYTSDPCDMMLKSYMRDLTQYLPIVYPETVGNTQLFIEKLMELLEGISDQITTHGFNSISIGTRLWYFKKITNNLIDVAYKTM